MKTIAISVDRNQPRLLSQRAINVTLWNLKQNNQISGYKSLGFKNLYSYDFMIGFASSKDAVLAKLSL